MRTMRIKKLGTTLALSLIVAGALQAGGYSYSETISVVRSEPVYRTVTKRVPYQECWDEQVRVNSGSSSTTTGGLIGGVAGGILGNQVGKGGGKTAATVGGAILGTLVGQNLANNNNGVEYKTVRKCTTRYDDTRERVIAYYKNYARYKDREIVIRSQSPMRTVRISHTISW